MKLEKLIPIALLIATVVVGYLLFAETGSRVGTEAESSPSEEIPPLLPIGPGYICLSWMDEETFTLLEKSCPNGVCDSHEDCATCAFDCGCGGGQICNRQSGICHSPGGVCQAPT